MMDIKPIRTEADYAEALREVECYFDAEPEPGTPGGDRFDVLSVLVEAYERDRHPIDEEADPIDVLHFAIESMGRSQAELAELLGSRSRASEVLNRRRHLNLAQVRAISNAWQLPISTLTAPYELVRASA